MQLLKVPHIWVKLRLLSPEPWEGPTLVLICLPLGPGISSYSLKQSHEVFSAISAFLELSLGLPNIHPQ